MISHLHIENIAVIEKMDILFGAGLNLLTGETGAGKSVVIDALGAVLGGRTSRDLVRTGAQAAQASAIFWKPDQLVVDWLQDKLSYVLEDDELHVSRDILGDGRTVCRVGGRPVTVAQLRELGILLVQVHGQHDSHTLLDESKHLSFVDDFGNCDLLLSAYQSEYHEWQRLCAQRDGLQKDAGDKSRQLELLQYQLEEIESAALQPDEDIRLQERRSFLKNAHKVSAAVVEAYALLYGDDESTGAHDLLSQASHSLSTVSEVNAELAELAQRVDDLMYSTDDVADEVRRLRDELEANPQELEQIESRLDTIYRLRKYGTTVADILTLAVTLQAELESIEHADERLEALEIACKAKLLDLEKAAGLLTKRRTATAKTLQGRLKQELMELDMEKVRFLIELQPTELTSKGKEMVRFLISTNVGEPPKPLSKVASGGELSRVMLALMNVLAGEVDTMVFDEIDTGISGQAAQRVAEKLGRLSRTRQILCVTHLPQIAAMADYHFHIEKDVIGDRTVTRIESLDTTMRIQEIARIIGGANITEVTRQSASELIEHASRLKETLN